MSVSGNIRKCLCVVAVLFLAQFFLRADSRQANAEFMDGIEHMKNGEYKSAAGNFKAAELFADDASMKAKAAKMEMEAFQKAGRLYDEFKCIQKLLKAYPTHVNYAEMVDREYEIGDKFFAGYRDVIWDILPWINDRDRTIEIYEAALKHGPFSKEAPQAKLRLARLYVDNGDNEKALKTLREAIKMYPGTKVEQFAYLDLANALLQLSEFGDGDGKFGIEARKVLYTYLQKYPDSKQAEWARKALIRSEDISAERLYNIGRFYHRMGRNQPATRYLSDVIREYPDALATDESEELLAKIDKDYKIPAVKPEKKLRHQTYEFEPIPLEPDPIMVVPENSNGKWLLPVRDLGLGSRFDLKNREKESKYKWIKFK